MVRHLADLFLDLLALRDVVYNPDSTDNLSFFKYNRRKQGMNGRDFVRGKGTVFIIVIARLPTECQLNGIDDLRVRQTKQFQADEHLP